MTKQPDIEFYYLAPSHIEAMQPNLDVKLLGGKAYHVARLMKSGISVPPAVVFPTPCCKEALKDEGATRSLVANYVEGHVLPFFILENGEGHPLVSVRSGAPTSMPGMMDTILNVGMNDDALVVWADRIGAWAAVDCYRRLIQMFATIVKGFEPDAFETILTAKRLDEGVDTDAELSLDGLCWVLDEFKNLYEQAEGEPFPQDRVAQIVEASIAVWKSWNGERAKVYRKQYKIADEPGTAVMIQSMVFGNTGEYSATGVMFTRDPSTGFDHVVGEFLPNAQGEDVVAGIRTPKPLEQIGADMSAALLDVADKIETEFGDMMEIEWTIDRGKLWVLQARAGKRTATAAVKIATDLAINNMIDIDTALSRLSMDHFLHSGSRPKTNAPSIATGLNASPGAVSGVVALSVEAAVKLKEQGKTVILVRPHTTPDDLTGMLAADGILTAEGGITSHAAVEARAMNKPSVVGCKGLTIAPFSVNKAVFNGVAIAEGEYLTICGSSGRVWMGAIDIEHFDAVETMAPLLYAAANQRGLPVRVSEPSELARVDFPWIVVGRPEDPSNWVKMLDSVVVNRKFESLTVDLTVDLDRVSGLFAQMTYDPVVRSAIMLAKAARVWNYRGIKVTVVKSDVPEIDAHVADIPIEVAADTRPAQTIAEALAGYAVDDKFYETVAGGKKTWEQVRDACAKAGLIGKTKTAAIGLGTTALAYQLIAPEFSD